MTTYKRRLTDLEEHLKGMPKERVGRVRRFFQDMYKELLTDSLTRLPTRRYFTEQGERLTAQAQRHDLPLSLLLIDIDDFKLVNDGPEGYTREGKTYTGHAAGDQLLKHMGHLIIESTRGGDQYARYGGEEIVACLPMTNIDQAYGVAERLRRKIERNTGHTVSIGLTTYPILTKKPNLDRLISHADHALYLAKEAGKNQTIIYPNGLVPHIKTK